VRPPVLAVLIGRRLLFCAVLACALWSAPGRAAATDQDRPTDASIAAAARPGASVAASQPGTLSSALPLQRDADPVGSGLGPVQALVLIVFLVICIGLLWQRQVRLRGSGLWQKNGWWRLISPAKPNGLRVIQSASLTPRASVHVVQWDGREWLVGCTERGLTELGQRVLPAAPDPQPGSAPETGA
jgi:Flagellar biosynthesis protein, FliO